jgi:hypothetical protein
MAAQVESKSAKKRKAKAEAAAQVATPQNETASHASDPPANLNAAANGEAGVNEHPYIKELSRYV